MPCPDAVSVFHVGGKSNQLRINGGKTTPFTLFFTFVEKRKKELDIR
jgi:hypothetical protein